MPFFYLLIAKAENLIVEILIIYVQKKQLHLFLSSENSSKRSLDLVKWKVLAPHSLQCNTTTQEKENNPSFVEGNEDGQGTSEVPKNL